MNMIVDTREQDEFRETADIFAKNYGLNLEFDKLDTGDILFDNVIKGPFRRLREEHIIIKVSFKAVEIGFISLLIFTCFLPRHIHIYFSISSLFLIAIISIVWWLKKDMMSILVEISIFIMIPFLIYLSETDVHYIANTFLHKAYSFSFGILIFFVLLTLKFTRRSGFKTTPMDFLILLIALVVPNLPDERIRHWQMGFVAAKIIVLFLWRVISLSKASGATRSRALSTRSGNDLALISNGICPASS